MQRESIGQTFKVTILLCLVCSFVVSLSAVGLRGKQEDNRERERKKNILLAAGLFHEDEHGNADVGPLFEQQVETRIIDLADGTYNAKKDPKVFDQLEEAKEAPSLSPEADPAGIKRREEHSFVYLVRKDGKLDQIVLPIRGYGLWSTLYGFIALDVESLRGGADQLVVRGLTYYQHAETPGLGGEVDNPLWKAKWKGKKVFDKDWNVRLEVTKNASSEYQVDALSGATLTSRGVTNMMKFWLGANGFKPFLVKQQQELAGQRPVGDGHG